MRVHALRHAHHDWRRTHPDQPGRYAADHRARRHVARDDRVRAHDSRRRQWSGGPALFAPAPNSTRSPIVGAPNGSFTAGIADRDPVPKHAVVADDRRAVNHDATMVLYRQTAADGGGGADHHAAHHLSVSLLSTM
jgi:hypothetical protein